MNNIMFPISIKRLTKTAVIPQYQTSGAAGLDLHADFNWVDFLELSPGKQAVINTGIAIALPHGVEGQVRPRSGLAAKHGITVLNSPGTIDCDYRGEIGVILLNTSDRTFKIERGMRIAQLVIAPVFRVELVETDDLDKTVRGDGKFGSTGLGDVRTVPL